jgi:uncharacterized protein (DUF697 family)
VRANRETRKADPVTIDVQARVLDAPAGDVSARSSSNDNRVAHCRALVSKKAVLAAGAAIIPVPGLDIAADVALLMGLIEEINQHFGLSQAQIEALAPSKKALAYKAITMVGSTLIGSKITQGLILSALKIVAGRVAGKQVSKFVPIAGQALAAALAYSAMRHVCFRHIDECARVSHELLRLESKPAS